MKQGQKVKMKVINPGKSGLPEIELRYKKQVRTFRGSSLGINPSLRDKFVRALADDFIRDIDGDDAV